MTAQDRDRGGVRETDGLISASLGAMRPLVGKLDMLLLAPPHGCSSKNVVDGMRLLRDDVKKISSYLDDLTELTDPPLRAKCWMNEVRDLSYDMEDYIDGLIFGQPEDPSLVPNNIKITRSIHNMSRHVKAPKTQVIIEEMLSEFRMYIQETIERHQRYFLHYCSTLRHSCAPLGPMHLPTTYEESEDIVIDGRMNEFINSVANDRDQQLKVVCVLGSTCLGKTTLAKVLYKKIGKNYSCRAFVRVSKKPDMRRVFHDMLLQLQRKDPSRDCKEVDLIDKIKEFLQDKRYLIIIDDVWAASVWDIINHSFPKSNQGSRIIATTQVEDVALTCCCYQSEYVFEMKRLDDDHSRKIFYNRVFGSQSDCPEHFKEVLNEIIELCDGLPFAIINIASLLASQPALSTNLLKYIHQSLSSCFSASERMRQSLNLSFNNLPKYLKTCLLYLIMYPLGYTFCNDDLVKLWVAEGFIITTEGKDMVKVAQHYLDQLICRRLINPICINYNNEVLSCAVHDVVYDLIACKSAEENFIVAIDYSQKNVLLSHKVRRLSLFSGDARYARTPINIRKSQVRSLVYFGLSDCMPCIREFKLLRVLNLQLSFHGSTYETVELNGISELFQLRYLKIACCRPIMLPKHGLRYLETLDIADAIIAFVPWDIHFPHLLNLHLNVPVPVNLLDCSGKTRSVSLALARRGNLNYLQDLHLTIPSTPIVHDLEKSMETLGYIIGGGEHVDLKSVVVAHGSSVKNGVVVAASDVIISWPDGLIPPPHLERFEFSSRTCIIFSRIPVWVGKLANLCILKIAVMELEMGCVYNISRLPALTALSLHVERMPDDKIIFGRVCFSVLKHFKLRFTSGIAWLKFEEDAMPNLLKLKLVFNAIPQMDQYEHGIISIEHMPSLREISVKFRGRTAGREYALISNHESNPRIMKQYVAYNSSGGKSRNLKQQTCEIREEERDEIVEEERDEYDKELKRPSDKSVVEFELAGNTYESFVR
ncbi:disease resistance protein RGA5-like [Hordeum vulgare subsp. vulgare]|uniref:disease resistance protein RGA5-like n=1 Tax=Hordeum vulgare subsp. vulgare TaxID=112509 RepID=UPI001D1A4BF3|nr:disease resistance protein RGA5-like [Hordeum vulgare subsp. vulgare]